jgi:hypothetical protein
MAMGDASDYYYYDTDEYLDDLAVDIDPIDINRFEGELVMRRLLKQSNPFRRKKPMAVKPLLRNVPIVGNAHRDEHAKAVFAGLKKGEELELHLEPTNPHDEFAVKVLVEGVHVGYIPRESSAVLFAISPDGKNLGDDVIAIVSEIGTKGGVRATIGLAELP